jgi:signal peptidase I
VTTTEEAPSAPARKRGSLLFELPILVLLALVLALLIKSFVVQVFFIPSGSMEQTLHVGDRVLVDKVSGHFRGIHRGDVVVFNGLDSFTPEVDIAEPGNPVARVLRGAAAAVGLAPPTESDFIKRVIGLPGDRVRCCDDAGRVTVNGVPIDESGYLYPGDRPSEESFDIVVPPGRLWVMGDHRSRSADSRAHLGESGGGTVPEDKVIGRAFVVLWPVNRLGGLGVPDAYARAGLAVGTSAAAAPYALGLAAAVPVLALGRRARRQARASGRHRATSRGRG